MEPLNQKERNSAFLKFVIMFICTIIVVLVAAFFDFKIPVKQNIYLQQENDNLKAQLSYQSTYLAKMDSLYNWILQMGKPGSDNMRLDRKAADMVVEMEKFQNDSTSIGKIIKQCNAAYAMLLLNKRDLLQGNQGTSEEIKKLNEKLKEKDEELKKKNEEYQTLLLKLAAK